MPLVLPRFSTARDESRLTLGPKVTKLARALGITLQDWQSYLLDIALEITPDGRFVYKDITFLTPRQNGKSTAVLLWMLHGMMTTPGSDNVYSAQTGTAARMKLLTDFYPLLDRNKDRLGVKQLMRSNGNEQAVLTNDSRLTAMSSSEDAVHSRTITRAILDEIWADYDNRRMDAIRPATSAIGGRGPQIVVCSTAGTEESVVLNAMIEKGRANVADGMRSGSCYFEWSAPEDCDSDDESVWLDCMPALSDPHSNISIETIRHELAMAPNENSFRRSYLNITTKNEARFIPAGKWHAVNFREVNIGDDLTMAVDVNHSRDRGSIVARDRFRNIYVVAAREGIEWIVPAMVELERKFQPRWVVDGSSSAPIAGLMPEIVRAGLIVKEVKPSDYPAACGSFYDAINEQTIRVQQNTYLTAAIGGCSSRSVGDAWVWSRKQSKVDLSPLVAATIALWVEPFAEYQVFRKDED